MRPFTAPRLDYSASPVAIAIADRSVNNLSAPAACTRNRKSVFWAGHLIARSANVCFARSVHNLARRTGRFIGKDVLLDPPLLVKISCGPTSVLDGGMLSAMYPPA